MKKTVLSACAALALSGAAQAATQVVDGITWTYHIEADRAVIWNDYDAAIPQDTVGDITVPATLGGVPVGAIDSYAFRDCTNLTSVVIPDSVTYIGWDAFQCCSSLTDVVIPDSVVDIRENVFYGCTALTDENGFVIIRGVFYYYAGDYDEELTVPDGVTRIASWAFVRGRKLTSITIPDSVTRLDDRAFIGCGSLTDITVPAGVTSVGAYAFSECYVLARVQYLGDMPEVDARYGESLYHSSSGELVSVVPEGAPGWSNALAGGTWQMRPIRAATPAGEVLVKFDANGGNMPTAAVRSVPCGAAIGELPEPERRGLSFDGWFTELEGGYMISADTAIQEPATFYAHWSECVETVDGITWHYNVKDGKAVVAAVELDGGIHPTIPAETSGAITVPATLGGLQVVEVGPYAFDGCTNLTGIAIPSGVTSIGYNAFDGCRALVDVDIPDSVTYVGEFAFYGCESLADSDGFIILDGVLRYYFGENADLTVPRGVTRIGANALSYNYNLLNVTIPSGVERIGYNAFGRCSHLTNVTVSASVKSMADFAFSDCYELTSVRYLGDCPTLDNSFGTTTLYNNSTIVQSYVPADADGWDTALVDGSWQGRSIREAMSPGPGTVSVVSLRTVRAGETLKVTLRRSGGNTGRIAVKYKTQTSTGICGKDFDYVKNVLVWENGESLDRTIEVPTHYIAYTAYPIALRIKLSTLTQGDYKGCVTPVLAESKIYFDMVDTWNPGEIVATAPNPLSVKAGGVLRMTLSRRNGSDGRISVKYKTQTSTGICGVNGSADFDYVKDILVWGPGDSSDKVIEIPTYRKPDRPYPLMLRVKLAPLATGVNLGNLVPRFESTKIYANITE